MEVPLRGARLVLLVSLLALPALPQQSSFNQRIPGRNWTPDPVVHPEPPSQSDLQAVRVHTIHEDAEQLSALSASMQSDLQQVQKGVLPRNFSENLKKMEKLSKKLRQEMALQ
jgi:hypothetical protein